LTNAENTAAVIESLASIAVNYARVSADCHHVGSPRLGSQAVSTLAQTAGAHWRHRPMTRSTAGVDEQHLSWPRPSEPLTKWLDEHRTSQGRATLQTCGGIAGVENLPRRSRRQRRRHRHRARARTGSLGPSAARLARRLPSPSRRSFPAQLVRACLPTGRYFGAFPIETRIGRSVPIWRREDD
jgi:hypothetical protein